MKTCYFFIAILLLSSSGMPAQVAPAATGASSNFDYILRYSQSAQFGGSYGDWQTAIPSGEIDYTNGVRRAPFALHFVGGYTWTLTGPGYTTGWFERLSLSQQVSGRKWQASLMDDVSYLPQTPVTGFSGIPGIGEPIGTPTAPSSNQSILTLGTYALYNNAHTEVTRILTGSYSLSAVGAYSLLRFPAGNGLDTDTVTAQGEITRRLNARNFLSGQYEYTQSHYPDTAFTFFTNSVMGIYDRDWTRSLHTSVSLGPQWINSSVPQLVPASTMLSVDAVLIRQFRRGSLSLDYRRGTSGGSGYMLGQKTDNLTGGYSRDFERKVTFELTGGFSRSTPLSQRGAINYEFGGVQLSRHLGRSISAFVNYTVMAQSSNVAQPNNVVQQPLQTISFGTTFEPGNRNRH